MSFSESSVATDPIAQFRAWFAEAQRPDILEPTAMSLATATADGQPSVRIVLLKHVDERGFAFFTDYRSRKGGELAANSRAALCFWWPPLGRQVRVIGPVERVSRDESAEYFATRPRPARIGAWSSHQSSVLPSRATLDEAVARNTARFEGGDVPLPPHWGGFRLTPVEVEFWQGHPDRLHDRVVYRKEAHGWNIVRLSP